MSDVDIIAQLEQFEAGWSAAPDRKSVSTHLKFETFAAAWAFMTEVAIGAERLDHHPEWQNVYNRVEIKLTTHDADGVTERDLELANVIQKALSARTYSVY
ncbi:4a-hydroxytetrahydrobiopterin dehydratase [Hirschia baltica]|uniref:Putative pterin-4-alpha-carbinolamine dehydratase n=1 Tax=Hirschia baltica (strain ATCC 49814 / DSM 5838 / IFAM 1418) TaxID=582402 RepID=C6XPR8_HIRBI|nr:4a-hydroxytetrahydrobiopterin dehydratase [Hirschia baltica]ACT60333.1 transcriptional coactivator/pterin dehydratase [Hirschia baltica ATCC 49814]